MTKAECVIESVGFIRHPEKDMTEEKHDGSFYSIRVWEMENERGKWTLWCDNYYGRSILFWNAQKLGDFEHRYDCIPAFVS